MSCFESAEKEQASSQSVHSVRLRLLVSLCLIISTVLAGYFPYRFFRILEYSRAIQEYHAVVTHTETSFQNGIFDKIESQRAVDTFLRSTCPLAATWPNCSLTPEIFEAVSVSMKAMGEMSSIGMAPLLSINSPQVILQFEQYASEVYLSAGITSFGSWRYPNSTVRGVASVSPETGVFHDLQGNPASTNDYIAPIMHFTGITFSATAAATVLFNLNYEQLRNDAIGDVVRCFEQEMALGNFTDDCQRITDFVFPQLNFRVAPAALILHPVAIEGQLKALVFTTHYWGTVIANSIPSYVNGLVVVISCKGAAYTYSFQDGDVGFAVKGDAHDRDDDDTRYCFVADVRGKDGLDYTICMYASRAYFADFEDNRAVYACVIGVMIAVVTAGLFFLYDFFLSRSAREHAVILATKRAFVRYISHEIRTPLNTVNIGLKVLMQELVGLSLLYGASHSSPPPSEEEQQHAKFNDKQKDLMELVLEIEDSSDTAVGILNDLINYDKLSMNKMQLELQVVDIWALLREAFAPFLIQARQKKIHMTLELDCDKPNDKGNDQESVGIGAEASSVSAQQLRVIGDSVKLAQVMRNLLSNALKFTPHDGCIEVTGHWVQEHKGLESPQSELSRASAAAGALRISVKDSGAGISAANQAELFKEGRQFNANRLQGGAGSGLGLFITQGVVLLHGGELKSYSAGEGHGSTFTLMIPVVHACTPQSSDCSQSCVVDLEAGAGAGLQLMDMPRKDSREAAYSVLQSSDDISGLSGEQAQLSKEQQERMPPMEEVAIRYVMVVDDSLPSRKMLCRLLTNGGYHCSQAENGQECVELMLKNREDNLALATGGDLVQMVFMDYEMPVMNGPDATKALRALGFCCPIIGVTGNVLPSDKDYFVGMGASEVLSKPLYLDDLNACVRKHSRPRPALPPPPPP